MATRSIASMTLGFGLVSIPVKLHSATEPSAGVHFHFLAPDGSRLSQQYVSKKTGEVVERADMKKGYEFEKDRYVVFSAEELDALDATASHTIDIVSFVPIEAVDPIFYDRAYYLSPDTRGAKPYGLLRAAMQETGRCARARFTFHGRQHVAQVRVSGDGLVLQQLLYGDEVRPQSELGIGSVKVSAPELKLAVQLIEQISKDTYDPAEFEDEEKTRVLAAIDEKIEGKKVVEFEPVDAKRSAKVIDLMEALRASLGKQGGGKGAGDRSTPEAPRRGKAPDRAAAGTPARRETKAAASAGAASRRARAGK